MGTLMSHADLGRPSHTANSPRTLQGLGDDSVAFAERISLLLDSTAEGICMIDVDGNCTYCNRSAAKMLGYDVKELLAKSMHESVLFKHADGSVYQVADSPIYGCLSNVGKVSRSDEVFWRKDGSSFPVEYWSQMIVENDECVGAVVTFVDITERLKVADELRAARDAAERANQAKSQFLANISHELRTPIAAILGFTEVLKQEVTDPRTHGRLDVIHRNGNYLIKLLNDVLDLSRIEAGKLTITKSSTPLGQLLDDVNELMQVRTVEYNNNLDFHYPGDLPVTISTDPARLRQVLTNLLANALKFSPNGQIDLKVHLDDANQNSRLMFIVKDNGIGISDEQQRHLFEPFQQADASISERFGGTGLGLSITRRLVEALGGEIAVESTIGSGSTFTVSIPVAPIGEVRPLRYEKSLRRDHVVKQRPMRNGTPGKLVAKVLIADDMRDVRFVAEHFLKRAGCSVHIAEDGRQAVDMVFNAQTSGKPFDLVLMDLQMPVLDGMSAVIMLRDQGCEVPVIALTADAMKGTRDKLLDAGFNEYLSKPLDAKSLLTVATKLVVSAVE
ncbi:hybrid sensor histidine kinase/response regulator [Rubripirellula reticaptiva]|uniref:histidine kinase n=1 Tax=Rubripirellula reticaptiva TaxID=2528013 RepID=A0A5C6EF31_9BACT|nr:ATP-binding protein [Rubripirellula reticaptiva]TWU46627.1 Autoinducer 2 sensor kinase/phosphatase LuxQ [Rubripirellula reticaptiva]